MMNSDDIGRINKLFNTCKFKIKEAPVGKCHLCTEVGSVQAFSVAPSCIQGFFCKNTAKVSAHPKAKGAARADLPKHILGYYKFIAYKGL